jgi:hypothetical protein
MSKTITKCEGCKKVLTDASGKRMYSGNFDGNKQPEHNGDESTTFAWCDECYGKKGKKMATFNLKNHLAKQASMAYEGSQGYFLAQQRAWMNCSKCQRESGKSAQEAWQACFDEFQKGDRKLSWLENYAKEDAGRVSKSAVAKSPDYLGDIVKLASGGMAIGAAVTIAIQKRMAQESDPVADTSEPVADTQVTGDSQNIVLRTYKPEVAKWAYFKGLDGQTPIDANLAEATRFTLQEARAKSKELAALGSPYMAVTDDEGDWSQIW